MRAIIQRLTLIFLRSNYFTLGLLLGLWLVGGLNELCAQDNFLLRRWSSEDGLNWGDIKAVARTPDGFLWIATDLGLVRFDGNQFQPLNARQFPVPAEDRAASLLVDHQGQLWVGTEAGNLLRRTDGKFQKIAANTLTGGKKINALAEDAQGAVWIATAGVGLRCYYQGNWQSFKQTNGLPNDSVTSVQIAAGQIWILAGGKLMVWNGHQFIAPPPLPIAESVVAIATTSNGELWAATTFVDQLLGGQVFRFKDGGWIEPTLPYPWPQDSIRSSIRSLLDDGAGGLWVATSGSGVFHWATNGTWNALAREGPMTDTTVNACTRDQEGTLWFGLQGGQLFRAHLRDITMLYPNPNPQQHVVLTACASRDGSVWVGTYGSGIFHYRDGSWTNYDQLPGLTAPHVFGLLEDRHTNLWVAARGGLFRLENGEFKKITTVNAGAFLSLFEDREGNLWVGSNGGLVRLKADQIKIFHRTDGLTGRDVCAINQAADGRILLAIRGAGLLRQVGDKFEPYLTHSPVDTADIRTLFFDQEGALWIATFGQGLFRLREGEIHQWQSQSGLPSDYLLSLVEDDRGRFWLGTANGIFTCSRDSLEISLLDANNPLLGRHLTIADGLGSMVCSGWGQPVAARTSDGRLWFPNQSGVAVFDPATLARKETKWPVIIEEISGDGVMQTPDHDGIIRIQSGLRQLVFQYTLANLLASATHFRYQLKGLEDTWTDAGQRREADYNHLPPGHYTFNVMASNPDGTWQANEHPIAIEIVPRWWERNSIRALIAIGVLGTLMFIVWNVGRARLRRRLLLLEAQRATEEERQRIARDLHDNLGAGLTEIALMSDLAQTQTEEPVETQKNLTEIFAAARSLTRSLDETVWAISRKNETVEQSLVFICKAAQDFLRLANISCRIEAPDVLPFSYFSSTVRHNLFLATREVLNNIVKHAQATEVWLRLKLEADRLTLIIEDNGKGFTWPVEPSPAGTHEPSRSGLTNLKKRLAEIDGTVEYHSEAGRGTMIKLSVRLKPEEPPPKS